MAIKRTPGVKQVVQSVTGLLAGRLARQEVLPAMFDYERPADVEVLSTGLRPLDRAVGLGGLPCGRITELVGLGTGPSGGGLTSLAARIAARVQRRQQVVSIVDLNHSFDPWQAERCGLVAPQLLLARPANLFAMLTGLERATRSQGIVIVALGFVDDLLGRVELQLLKTLTSRLRRIIRRSNSVFLFTTLLRQNDPFNPALYPAGFPLADLADVRLWVQEEAWTFKEDQAVAYKANLTVIKNRLAIAGTGADIRIKFSELPGEEQADRA